ncbi:MAG: hypothetical protein ACKO1J_10090 [Tagaea sp.]
MAGLSPDARFAVSLRLYHGWHKGFEPTTRRKLIVSTAAAIEFSNLSARTNVLFRDSVEYGDRLVAASLSRLHPKLAIHLPGTLRDRGDAIVEEKMVDTAIASDSISTAVREPDRWILIVSDDDDLVPAAFTVEGLRRPDQKRVHLLRRRVSRNLLKLEGMVIVA